MVINAVGHLAEAAWHHPDIAASYAFVIVKLVNHAAKGVTDKDFELLDQVARFSAQPDASFDDLRSTYESMPQLRPPESILTYK